MKFPVRKFRSLAVALKELEPHIRNGDRVQTGRPFKNFGKMLPREAIANLLLCIAINSTDEFDLNFTTDPTGGDGILIDERKGETWRTEHVIVPRLLPGEVGDAESSILNAIADKNGRGETYAARRVLVVLANAASAPWHPNRVARQLPAPLHFSDVWTVCLQRVEDDEYIYAVTHLDVSAGDAPTFIICIARDFQSWTVTRIQ